MQKKHKEPNWFFPVLGLMTFGVFIIPFVAMAMVRQ